MIGQHQHRKVVVPGVFGTMFHVDGEHHAEGTVKPFNQPVRLRVIGGSPCFVNPEENADLREEAGFKVLPLVGVDSVWSSIAADPLINQSSGYSGRLTVG